MEKKQGGKITMIKNVSYVANYKIIIRISLFNEYIK